MFGIGRTPSSYLEPLVVRLARPSRFYGADCLANQLMARWPDGWSFYFKGRTWQDKHIQNCIHTSLHSVKTPSTTGGSSLFCLCKLTITYPYILQKSKKKLSVTLQTWKTIHNDTYLSPKKSSTIPCHTWIVWEMVQKIIPENEKTDTLKPWSELDLLDFLDTWWCLARMILLYKQVPLYWSEVYLYFYITWDLRCWTLWACLGENCR